MIETRLLIPVDQASEWEWLDDALLVAADKAGIEDFDGGEEEGEVYVYSFGDHPIDEVLPLVRRVLRRARPTPTLEVTGEREITVTVPPQPWLRALGPAGHPYPRAVKKLCTEVAADPDVLAWWSTDNPYRRLWFHQSKRHPGDPSAHVSHEDHEPADLLLVTVLTDLTILNDDRPPRAEVRTTAGATVRTLLDAVADHLGRPRPHTALLDEP